MGCLQSHQKWFLSTDTVIRPVPGSVDTAEQSVPDRNDAMDKALVYLATALQPGNLGLCPLLHFL